MVSQQDEALEEAERIIDSLLDQQAMPDEGMDDWVKRWKETKRALSETE